MIQLSLWSSAIAELFATLALGSGGISGYLSPTQDVINTGWLSEQIESAMHSLLFGSRSGVDRRRP